MVGTRSGEVQGEGTADPRSVDSSNPRVGGSTCVPNPPTHARHMPLAVRLGAELVAYTLTLYVRNFRSRRRRPRA
jgi:hypothetical protein